MDDLRKEVQDLQKEINAHEQKGQQQQINQLKKALKELKKKVEAQQQQDHKEKKEPDDSSGSAPNQVEEKRSSQNDGLQKTSELPLFMVQFAELASLLKKSL